MAALAIDRMLDAGARPKEDDATNAKDILGLNVQRFALAPTPDPALFSKENFGVGYGTDNHQKVQFAKGTTTLAFKFDGGVIISVDSRSTMGPYIASQTVKKSSRSTPSSWAPWPAAPRTAPSGSAIWGRSAGCSN